MGKLFALVFELQKDIIKTRCFQECGRIIFGCAQDTEYGVYGLCRQPAAECPALDREMDEPMGEVRGEPIYLRKLKSKEE